MIDVGGADPQSWTHVLEDDSFGVTNLATPLPPDTEIWQYSSKYYRLGDIAENGWG